MTRTFGRSGPKARRPARSKAHRIVLEGLEDRLTPSTLMVTNTVDNRGVPAPGSLRAAILDANRPGNQNSTVVISPSVTSSVINLTAGELPIKASMTIENASGHPLTIQQTTGGAGGSGNGRIFHVPSASRAPIVNIVGADAANTLTLSGGSVRGSGGAILVNSSGTKLTLSHVNITGNSALASTASGNTGAGANGGGIYSRGSVTLADSVVTSNRASGVGGGILAMGGVSLANTAVGGNRAQIGAGVVSSFGNVTLDGGSSVSGNQALSGSVGGIGVSSGSVIVQNGSHVDANSAGTIGGILVDNGAVSVTGGSTVNGNVATGGKAANRRSFGGGGIVNGFGDVAVSGSQVNSNRVAGVKSGGITAILGNVTVGSGSQVNSNTSDGPGGGIAVDYGGAVSVTGGSQVNGNVGAAIGGGVVNFSNAGSVTIGGASQVDSNTLTNRQSLRQALVLYSQVNAANRPLVRFAAAVGGQGRTSAIGALRQVSRSARPSIRLVPKATRQLPRAFGILQAGGGVATLLGSSTTISGGSEVVGNRSGKLAPKSPRSSIGIAGGILSPNGQLTIDGSFVNNNRSSGAGGGIWNGGGLSLVNTMVSSNAVAPSTSAGLSNSTNGGGLFNAPKSGANVLGSTFLANQASYGGGIANQGTLSISNSTVAQNRAGVQGGGIDSRGSFSQNNVVYVSNTPNDVYPPQ